MATTPTPPRKTRFGKQRLAAGGSLLVLALLALILRTAVTNPPGDSLNVLLITLDTTRADRLGCYGCRWAHTPALDGLARAGWKFENAFTQVPFTLPAHATILTGRYPAGHGLRDNESGGLPGGIGTLPEIFREHGYATAAFVASFTLDKRFGLGRGFDLYDDRPDESSRGRELPANTVAGRALAWMEKNAGRPFFCWIHFFDPHFPYDPPSAYLGAGIDPYDGEIAFMDAQIGRILDFLDRRGLSGRTLVVAAGDHGEALGEHGENEHGLLVYEGSMRVPLILRIPGRTGGIDVGRAAGLVDLAPSVLDALGWPLPAGMAGQSLLDDGSGPGECYGESLFGFYSHRWAPLYSLTTSR
ncbi:MAG TPA: sulfatase, partial [bacterium]|nr:sulfatase [bacterium]